VQEASKRTELFEKTLGEAGAKELAPYVFKFGAGPMELAIIVCLHGNETAPLDAVIKIIKLYGTRLNSAHSNVLFAIGNPLAVEQNVRYTEVDMNRVFGSTSSETYEERRMSEIISVINAPTFLLDLHQTIEKTKSPFGIYEVSEQRNTFMSSMSCVSNVVNAPPHITSKGGTLDDFYQDVRECFNCS
jgi:succinylglutamate desuccinylase